MIKFSHKPVMLEECMDGLNLKSDGIYFDGTLGGGGHSFEILKRTSPNGKLIATDLDDDAIKAGSEKLKEFENRFKIVKSNYKNFAQVFDDCNVDKIDGALLDFGVSSFQLDERDRGFSYIQKDAPLDMRMDKQSPLSAEVVVNEYDEYKLFKIIRDYGEDSFAKNIAKNICIARQEKRLATSGELVEIIERSIPKKLQLKAPPARKTFQAIRIEVNGELEGLYDCVYNLALRLKKGGRIAILTFHSLEDRIVKRAFQELEKDCICDKSLPICVCGKRKEIEIITKKPIIAKEQEQIENSRSKCAKLRIAERV